MFEHIADDVTDAGVGLDVFAVKISPALTPLADPLPTGCGFDGGRAAVRVGGPYSLASASKR